MYTHRSTMLATTIFGLLLITSVSSFAQGGYSDLFNMRMNGNDVKPTTTAEDLRKQSTAQGQTNSQFSTIITGVPPAALARVTQAGMTNDIGVTIFDQKDLTGNSALFGPGIYRADNGVINGMQNDSAMSLVIAKGYRVMLCENEGDSRGGAGRCERPTAQASNLLYPRTASWIIVSHDETGTQPQNDTVQVFAGPGNTSLFGVGIFMANGGRLGMIPNDAATSITVPRGLRARVCEHEGRDRKGDGDCEEFGEGAYMQMRKPRTASWIRVWKQ